MYYFSFNYIISFLQIFIKYDYIFICDINCSSNVTCTDNYAVIMRFGEKNTHCVLQNIVSYDIKNKQSPSNRWPPTVQPL